MIKVSEKELIELMKNVKQNFPNEFYETIGFMRGLKTKLDNERKSTKINVEYETKNQ
ncbi:hypothetical protein [Romboutsia ilealis]|uniref:hypothetical protein n=1 Tax=Romboutsia ilealis TaxID=1115758 RepID=UPI0025706FAB|nr:hypothetical protein [Romboutsia ilealis]